MARQTAAQLIKEIEDKLYLMSKQLGDMAGQQRDLGWETKIIKKEIGELRHMLEELKKETVPNERYTLVEKIVFGLVGIVLAAVAYAVIARVGL